MDILFLDANVLFSAAYRPQAGLLKFWKIPKIKLITSRYAYYEAEINLAEPTQKQRLQDLAKKLTIYDVLDTDSKQLPKGIHVPEKDVPILLAAIKVQATHLITGDFHDFGRYFGKKIEGVLILPPASYLALKPNTRD